MRFIHLSDLHLGKRVNEFSMLEDQEYILAQILCVIDREQPQAVVIAGDVYDKSVPSGEAVQLFDDFLFKLSRRVPDIFIISGNHDSPERLAFGGRLLDKSGVHLSPVYDGRVAPVTLEDTYGPVNFYLLPFVKPVHVRRAFPEEKIESYTDAVRAAVAHMDVDPSARNVLAAHQFVTGADRSDSEDASVGGLDNVDGSVFDAFDYVALGHLHGPQSVGRETVRYCGTPLKYSFSEAEQVKSVTCVDLGPKGTVEVRTIPLTPRHDMRSLRGTYYDLTLRPNYEGTAVDDYLRIVLTDEEDVPDGMQRLRAIYPNLMALEYDNRRTRSRPVPGAAQEPDKRTPLDLLGEFYEKQNGAPMGPEQAEFARKLMEEIWEGEN